MKPPPIPAKPELDVFLAPLLALIASVFQLLVGAPRQDLRRAIERAERAVQCFIFLKAVARAAALAPRQRRRLNTPPGFRRGCASRRLFFRYARIADRGGSFAQRIARLVTVLANPERHIARFVKLVLRGRRAAALIAIAPLARAWRDAAASVIAFADSS